MQDHATQALKHSGKKTSIMQDHAAEAKGTEAWSGIKIFAERSSLNEFTANFPSSMLGSFVKKKTSYAVLSTELIHEGTKNTGKHHIWPFRRRRMRRKSPPCMRIHAGNYGS
ncbi:hypothetical protein QYE76_028714 [Lolium multiflorum]|uniref:Uncharacterized protein n=1 Tax=Lolium multiflorum TaxID=4521 RepID=A0AAD8QLI1_LOLMU|nr:hypothetical protein QYE76_028714 [Lolium multiflorum]